MGEGTLDALVYVMYNMRGLFGVKDTRKPV